MWQAEDFHAAAEFNQTGSLERALESKNGMCPSSARAAAALQQVDNRRSRFSAIQLTDRQTDEETHCCQQLNSSLEKKEETDHKYFILLMSFGDI